MNKGSRIHKKWVFHALCVVVLSVIFLPIQSIAQENGGIGTAKDLHQVISQQIMNHEEKAKYKIDSGDVYYRLKTIIGDYKYHYCSTTPILSGSYLMNYVDNIHYTYWEERHMDGTTYYVEIEPMYLYGKQEMDSFFAQMEATAQTLKGETDYQSIKSVYNYVISQVDYDYGYQNYLDYEGFQTGKMVCSGYSMALFLLLSDMDIPVRIITGKSENKDKELVGHAWNIVQLDGQWYNLDATWDDRGKNRKSTRYFLKGAKDFDRHVCDEKIQKEYSSMVSIMSYKKPFADRIGETISSLASNYNLILIIIVVLGTLIKTKGKGINAE